MSNNWFNYKKLKFLDAKNTKRSMLSFSRKKLSEKSELQVDERSTNRPTSSDVVIDFVVQSESRPWTSTSTAQSQFTLVAESETWLKLCIYIHYV